MYVTRPFQVHLAVLCMCLFAQGCSSFRVPDEPLQPTPVTPVWDAQALYDHIRFLNRDDVHGRATGTQAYARAAAYVASRLSEYGLQPAVEGDFRTIYSAPINFPIGGHLRAVGLADSVVFLPGVDFLADGRSDSGEVAVSRFVVVGHETPPEARLDPPFGIIVLPGEEVDLASWQRSGAQLALLVGPLRPRFGERPIRDFIVMQITPDAVRRLLRPGNEPLEPYLDERRGEAVFLGRTLRAHAISSFQARAGAINMLGYFSGKHPLRRHELVILCADMDALGRYAGINIMDFQRFGTATAALLEVVRNVGFVTQRWQVPDRTIMVAIWSGSRVGHAGLRAFLENATWPLSRIHSVVYVGLTEDDRRHVQAILDERGIRLAAVPPPATPLHTEDILLVPDTELLRVARSQDRSVQAPEALDMSQLIDSAVVRAQDLADRAFRRLMMETTHPDSFLPVDEGALQPPTVGASR